MVSQTRGPASGPADVRARLSTVVAIPVTPFGDDGLPDWETHRALVRRLVASGVTVVTANGNTGEFYALSPAETRCAVESAVAAVDGAADVMAGVGLDTGSAADAARHARDSGAASIMVHQPVHPYRSAEGWIAYHAAIADAVPELGVVLYVRDPRVTGARIAELADRSPNVVGVKYAVPDPVAFASVARDAGTERFTWIAGLAELYAPGHWAVGATGFTSGLVNVAPRLSTTMLGALRAGDGARAMTVWDAVRRFEELRAADAAADNVSVVKEALAQLGLCAPVVRPPSRPLPDDVRAEISTTLTHWKSEGWL